MNKFLAILLLLAAPCNGFCQVSAPLPTKTPTSLAAARVAFKQLTGALQDGQQENVMLTQKLSASLETQAETQKADLATQAQINKLSDFATAAQLEAQRAAVDRDKARLEAHENAKERDVFLFTICALVTVYVLTILRPLIAAFPNPLIELAMWVGALGATFGAAYFACRIIVAIFAKMIP